MVYAIDCSNFSGAISATQARELYDRGVRRAIVQFVSPTILVHEQQFPALVAANIEVEAYVYQWFSAGPDFCAGRMDWAIAQAKFHPSIRRIWLDCEQSDTDTPPFYYTSPLAAGTTLPIITTSASQVMAAGLQAGVYAAAWWWRPATGDSTSFAALPLWEPRYDGVASLEYAGFGGWGRQVMHQYQGSSTIAGVPLVDLDWEEDDVETTPVQNADAIAFLQKFVAGETDIISRNNGAALDAIVGQPGRYIVTLPKGA